MSRVSLRSVYSFTVPRNFVAVLTFYLHPLPVACFDHCIPRERLIGVLLNIHPCFSVMDTHWALKLGRREVNLSVWPFPEFERD